MLVGGDIKEFITRYQESERQAYSHQQMPDLAHRKQHFLHALPIEYRTDVTVPIMQATSWKEVTDIATLRIASRDTLGEGALIALKAAFVHAGGGETYDATAPLETQAAFSRKLVNSFDALTQSAAKKAQQQQSLKAPKNKIISASAIYRFGEQSDEAAPATAAAVSAPTASTSSSVFMDLGKFLQPTFEAMASSQRDLASNMSRQLESFRNENRSYAS